MRSPVAALVWELWRRNRRLAWLVAGIILFSWIFNLVLPDSFRSTEARRQGLLTINCFLLTGSLLLVFGIFNYTEFNPQKEWTGFPYRLFALPVTSLRLVAVPLALGVASVGIVFWAWIKLVFTHGELARPEWLAVLLGAYMIFYQAILWIFAGFRTARIILLGFTGTSFVGVAFLPSFAEFIQSPWFSEKVLIGLFAGLSLAAFLAAWTGVARQRSGGGRRQSGFKRIIERMADALPRRRKNFCSAAGAQFWFEWRRTGLLLPLCIGALLVLVIGPLSWGLRDESEGTLWILGWTLALPVVLAGPLGKGFSRPDFWSRDLSLPAFVTVRPLATGEMIVIKMKVAALSAAISCSLVLAFLSVWLPLWANLDSLCMIRIGLWMAYDHTLLPQYAIAALFLAAAVLLTWKCLVGGLWIGLSGNRKLFIASGTVYCLLPLLGLIGFILWMDHQQAIRAGGIDDDPNRLLTVFEWVTAIAVSAKLWLAASAWRRIAPRRVRRYVLAWLGGTLCLIALAILLWADGTLSLVLMEFMGLVPLDVYRLRNLLVLVALLVIPFARLGLAPDALARNRHR